MDLQQIIYWIPAITGAFALIIGLLAVVSPQKASQSFGIEVHGLALPYVMATGVRDIYIGLVTLILFRFGNTQLLGANFICIAVIAIADFILTFKVGSRRHSVVHIAGAVFSLIFGIILLSK